MLAADKWAKRIERAEARRNKEKAKALEHEMDMLRDQISDAVDKLESKLLVGEVHRFVVENALAYLTGHGFRVEATYQPDNTILFTWSEAET